MPLRSRPASPASRLAYEYDVQIDALARVVDHTAVTSIEDVRTLGETASSWARSSSTDIFGALRDEASSVMEATRSSPALSTDDRVRWDGLVASSQGPYFEPATAFGFAEQASSRMAARILARGVDAILLQGLTGSSNAERPVAVLESFALNASSRAMRMAFLRVNDRWAIRDASDAALAGDRKQANQIARRYASSASAEKVINAVVDHRLMTHALDALDNIETNATPRDRAAAERSALKTATGIQREESRIAVVEHLEDTIGKHWIAENAKLAAASLKLAGPAL